MISLLLFVSLTASAAFAQSISWSTGDQLWANNCDFAGNDLKNIDAPGDQCYSLCQANLDCTHFAWSNWDGRGHCYLKSGPIVRSQAKYATMPAGQSIICGIVREGLPLKKGALLWSDEFNDLGVTNQNFLQETGGHGFGNQELQMYQDGNKNIAVSGGLLNIQARLETIGTNRYTSARLVSKRSFKYGVFEMRAKLPIGRGTWPAFWLLAAKRPLSWPADGEIDIMEYVGYETQNGVGQTHATIHCTDFNGGQGTQKGAAAFVSNVDTQFHLYQVEWTPTSIKGYVDDRLYFIYNKPVGATQANWPYDNEFNMILNFAVGGAWGGVQGVDDTSFPKNYVIDYVRQYNLA